MGFNILRQPKLLVLMVDDNMRFVERMKGLLTGQANVGDINVASDYEEACRSVKSDAPDVILLDINLPGRNGMELLKEMRRRSRDCKIIMLTNHSEEYYRQQCTALGADYFLDKSHDFAKVPEIIARLTGS